MPNGYCRACGEFLPDFNKPKQFSLITRTPEENVAQSIGYIIPSIIFAFLTTVIMYGTLFGWFNNQGLLYFAAACSLCILIWQIFNIFVALKLRRRFKSRKNQMRPASELNASGNNSLPAADTSQFVRPVTSVTENTTSLLEPVPTKNTQKFD